MLSKITSAAVVGVQAQPVHVEVMLVAGAGGFSTVGLPEMSVREGRVRVRAAIRESELPFLSPSAIRPITWPTFALSSGATSCSVSTPAAGLGDAPASCRGSRPAGFAIWKPPPPLMTPSR